MLVRFVVFLSSLTQRIVVNLMRLLSVVLVLLLIVKVLQLICAVILMLSVWIWLKIFFVLVFGVLALVRPLFTLILILINLIVFGFMIEMSFSGFTANFYYRSGLLRCEFSLTYHPRSKDVSYELNISNLSCKQFSRVFSRCCKCFYVYYGLEHKKSKG